VTDPYVTTSTGTVDGARTPGAYAWFMVGLGVLFGGIAVVVARTDPDSPVAWAWLLFPVMVIAGDTIRSMRRRP
jgi:hypothetical protein